MTLRISVVGTGYLGATHAACMAELGHEVTGVDIDPAKVAALAAGRAPFYEPGLGAMIARHTAAGRLRFTTDIAEAAEFADVHFLCVGTPQKQGEFAADMTHLDAAVDALAPSLRRACLVVGKSTVPVGTAARLADRLAALAPAGADAELAWNPEFLREGHAVEDTLRPDRIVFGVASAAAEKTLRAVYAGVINGTGGAAWDGCGEPGTGTAAAATQQAAEVPVVVTDFATAEITKAAANAFLATKISFINAMAEVCEAAGADVTQLSEALSYDPRIGGRFLQAGLGFGGGCLPKDIRAFMARAGELGADQALTFLREVDEINMRRRSRMIDLARELCDGSFLGRRVAVLGAAFKPESDDTRDSPALNVAASIQLRGAQVTVYDPRANDNAARIFPTLAYADSAVTAARGADVVLHLTEWREFREMSPDELSPVVGQRRIVDGRNALDPIRWRSAGWTYRALGRP